MKSALIVIDDATVRLTLLRGLGRHGWWVDAVGSVPEVLKFLVRSVPDIVVIDRDIELGSGLSLVIAIKSDPLWSSIPVVLTCAKASLLDVAEALESGADDFLRQPLNIEDTIGCLTPLALRNANPTQSI